MKEILSACSRRVVWQLGAATAVITAGMYAAGKLFLVPAFFIIQPAIGIIQVKIPDF